MDGRKEGRERKGTVDMLYCTVLIIISIAVILSTGKPTNVNRENQWVLGLNKITKRVLYLPQKTMPDGFYMLCINTLVCTYFQLLRSINNKTKKYSRPEIEV